MANSATGACLCGSSKVTIKNYPTDGELDFRPPKSHIRCHCKDCALTSGSAFSTNVLIKEIDTTFTGKISKYAYKVPSGNTVTRFTGPFVDVFKQIPFGTELFPQGKWAGVDVPKANL
ncbi:hypothetical protein JCM6882_002520 [Rhodosporidiobolus microsporus]